MFIIISSLIKKNYTNVAKKCKKYFCYRVEPCNRATLSDCELGNHHNIQTHPFKCKIYPIYIKIQCITEVDCVTLYIKIVTEMKLIQFSQLQLKAKHLLSSYNNIK